MVKIPDNLILFDPMCNLCSAIVKYLLKYDKRGLFFYGSLFSASGKQIKKSLTWKEQKNTIIYFEKNLVFTQSDAAIRIITSLPGFHKLLLALKIFPKSFRDWAYKIVAKYRYQWFGKREKPFLPNIEFKNRFIDYDALLLQNQNSN